MKNKIKNRSMYYKYITNASYDVLNDELINSKIKDFVLQNIYVRSTILGLVLYARKLLKKNMSILDVGAGDCPYRTIFKDLNYSSTDFGETNYHDFKHINYLCSADNIPVKNESFDAILCTEVLEHVYNTENVIKEFNRILKKEGGLFITIPFIFNVHEEPFDFTRYTHYFLKKILTDHGFKIKFITPRGGKFLCLGVLSQDLLLQKNKKYHHLFIYVLCYIPVIFPLLIINKYFKNIFIILDKFFDNEKIWTPGYAIYTIKK